LLQGERIEQVLGNPFDGYEKEGIVRSLEDKM